MYGIFIIGTAGSGKTLMAASLAEWLAKQGEDTAIVNLDPGVLNLPYKPDVDVRDYISIEELMDRFGLGPNGALIMASDLLAQEAEKISEALQEVSSRYILFDTPGQMELFAFRVGGPYLARELHLDQKMILYLFDGPFCSNPFNYVSTLFLASAVHLRFMLPQLNVLTKIDLMDEGVVREILEWSRSPARLREALLKQQVSGMSLLAGDLFKALTKLRLDFSTVACSAKYFTNFLNVQAAIERILTRGEKEEA
ncbi:MAG: ATP/GTP-binding protein [Candidatus Hecatellaceae archaeon]